MSASVVRRVGLALTLAYGGFITWLYVERPQSFSEIRGGIASTVGLYMIDVARFQEGRHLLHADRFPEARAAFERADPARRDAVTQFYIAYSFYRQGWGRFYNDDALFQQALQALDRATALSPSRPIRVNDPALGLPTSDALRAELRRGLDIEAEDFNPFRALRSRK
jgi:hypothetical protein